MVSHRSKVPSLTAAGTNFLEDPAIPTSVLSRFLTHASLQNCGNTRLACTRSSVNILCARDSAALFVGTTHES